MKPRSGRRGQVKPGSGRRRAGETLFIWGPVQRVTWPSVRRLRFHLATTRLGFHLGSWRGGWGFTWAPGGAVGVSPGWWRGGWGFTWAPGEAVGGFTWAP